MSLGPEIDSSGIHSTSQCCTLVSMDERRERSRQANRRRPRALDQIGERPLSIPPPLRDHLINLMDESKFLAELLESGPIGADLSAVCSSVARIFELLADCAGWDERLPLVTTQVLDGSVYTPVANSTMLLAIEALRARGLKLPSELVDFDRQHLSRFRRAAVEHAA